MSATAEGAYTQYCSFCEQPCGHTDDGNLIEIVGECCVGLPEPWSMGRNGLYGTDDYRSDLPGYESSDNEDEDYEQEDEPEW